jgi:hypothetical protein
MSDESGSPSSEPQTHDNRRQCDAEIEVQIRSIYGARLEACERVHRFGQDALYFWAGRPLDPASVDAIIVAEASRATKTYGAAVTLAAGGYGAQAIMLNRSLFEGTAVAHWAHANPARAVELFKQHGRQAELLWGDEFEKAAPEEPRSIDTGTDEERDELAGLFGRGGGRLWTGHRSLYDLLPEIEQQWPEGEVRETLWWYFRIVNRHSNEVLHSTPLGLSGGVTRGSESLDLDAGPSNVYLDQALLGGLWPYMQTLTLLWDHFEIPERQALDRVYADADAAFQSER